MRRALHYYVPCVVRGRMVAVIGLGRSVDGALLSSEDVEILRTVSGYVAVAIENSLLYQEQQERAGELKLLKEFNESIIESINVGLLAVDLDGRVTRLNSALEHILDLASRCRRSASELKICSLKTLPTRSAGAWVTTDGASKRFATSTKSTLPRALAERWCSTSPLLRLQDAQGQTGALVVVEDVTSRISLEEQLQQREKLSSIGLLAAGVAHEVNTPLTGVSSYTQMLLGMLPETDPKHALLQKVRRQAERATNIVNNLLNFSRTGSATEFGEVDIARVLDDTLQLLEPQMRRSQIEIVRAYDQDAPRGLRQRRQAAAGFHQPVAECARRDSRWRTDHYLNRRLPKTVLSMVEVADTGIGIAPENVAKIYDPFYTTKGVGRGTGLGLAVSYGIVQEHSGHISVESTPGQWHNFPHHFADRARRVLACKPSATKPTVNNIKSRTQRRLSLFVIRLLLSACSRLN